MSLSVFESRSSICSMGSESIVAASQLGFSIDVLGLKKSKSVVNPYLQKKFCW